MLESSGLLIFRGALKVKFLPIYCKGSALQVVMDKEPGLQEEIARTKKLRSLMGIGYNNNEW